MEEIWNFGYRCEILETECFWEGAIYVPRWHPVRVGGLDDNLLVLMIGGEWNVFIESVSTHQRALTDTIRAAYMLRVMQDKWDSLSPYEREYLVLI